MKSKNLLFNLLLFILFVSAVNSALAAENSSDAPEGIPLETKNISIDVPNPNIETPNGHTDTISMSFDGALLKDVLLLFSQQSGLNFVASQEVEGKKVTVFFENVSPKDALSAIIAANGLIYTKKPGSDIYLVYPASKTQPIEVITKVIHLKYLRLSNSPLDVGGQVTISDLAKSAATSSGKGIGTSSLAHCSEW